MELRGRGMQHGALAKKINTQMTLPRPPTAEWGSTRAAMHRAPAIALVTGGLATLGVCGRYWCHYHIGRAAFRAHPSRYGDKSISECRFISAWGIVARGWGHQRGGSHNAIVSVRRLALAAHFRAKFSLFVSSCPLLATVECRGRLWDAHSQQKFAKT